MLMPGFFLFMRILFPTFDASQDLSKKYQVCYLCAGSSLENRRKSCLTHAPACNVQTLDD